MGRKSSSSFVALHRRGGARSGHVSLRTPSFHRLFSHTCPNKIFSGLIRPIPHASPMDNTPDGPVEGARAADGKSVWTARMRCPQGAKSVW